MALDLETIKSLQTSLADMNTISAFITKVEESKEISFTVGSITTKISAKDEENFKVLQNAILDSNYRKLDNLYTKVSDLINSNGKAIAAEKLV